MILVLGAVGLPGTSGFIGEFLVLVGAFQKNYLVGILALVGVILAAAYMLWLYKRVIFGKIKNLDLKTLKDLNFSEMSILVLLAFVILVLGFYPQPILDTMSVSVDNLIINHEKSIGYQIVNNK
tara:strand:- start:151 stop:522 length:372 start_codon:yes stop_codon:yes gene_type:complete